VPECIGASNVSQRDLGESLTCAAGGMSKEYSEDSPFFQSGNTASPTFGRKRFQPLSEIRERESASETYL
jgi:hypothetical protein